MLLFKRKIENQIRKNLFSGSMVTILGPRQSGKTTLSKTILDEFGSEGEYYNCEFADVRKHFVLGKPQELYNLVQGKKIVVFDEAQTIHNIGKILKTFHDTYPDIQVIATGSSSFDLSNKIKEPMTGRALEYTLLPLSLSEIRTIFPNFSREQFESFLNFGMYPAVIVASDTESKALELKKIATNYLYKDIFIFENVRNTKVFEDLLIWLAYHIGHTISIAELAKEVGSNSATIERYMRLLEQSFVIKRVYSYAKNFVNELKKSYKVYFYDTGIRNILVNNFNLPDSDKGFVFENFVFNEIQKYQTSEIFPANIYFWRTKQKLEIDILLEKNQKYIALECKWQFQKVSFNKFLEFYPNTKTQVIDVNWFLNGGDSSDIIKFD
jgi:predicted AAA+ superfamily ATPase